jgi:hypothetical protein
MGTFSRVPGGRVAVLAGGCVLAGGLAVLPGAAAGAAPCGTATGSTCTSTGTVALTAGTLTLTSPAALGWSGTVNGLDQQLVDATPADQALTVVDATGAGAGWHITVAATQFANGAKTLANAGTFSLTGSVTSLSSASAPTAACGTASTCVLPTDTTVYPVAITTAASAPPAVTVYDTSAATGQGAIALGSPAASPVGWWIRVPASAAPGSYTSTITLGIISGP